MNLKDEKDFKEFGRKVLSVFDDLVDFKMAYLDSTYAEGQFINSSTHMHCFFAYYRVSKR